MGNISYGIARPNERYKNATPVVLSPEKLTTQ
jgi:hypothetical protein